MNKKCVEEKMERKNERGPDDVFTACLCPKCNEYYEADRKHVCRRRNSYPMQVTEETIDARRESNGA